MLNRKGGSFARRFAVLGGADPLILDQVPSASERYVQMFFVLVGTASLSALSMLFALVSGVRIPLWIGILLALFWGLLIFNLDRFLTSTMKSTRSIPRLLGLALPRVAMAVLIGIVVAEPLVLQAFKSDIAQEMTSTNLVRAQADQASLDTGPEKLALDDARQRLTDLETQAATGAVPNAPAGSATVLEAQGAVDRLKAQVAEQESRVSEARELYQCERQGPERAGDAPGCSGVAGEGPSTDAARASLASAESIEADLNRQLKEANDKLAAAESASQESTSSSEVLRREEAEAQLPSAREAYQAALATYNSRAADTSTSNADAEGLLNQIHALSTLSERDPALAWAHRLIAGLFFMIELLPVLVKVLTSYGDRSLYEEVEDLNKRSSIDAAKVERNHDRWRTEQRSKMRRRVEQDMFDREQALGEKSNQHIANEMTEILDVALADWSKSVSTSLKSSRPPASP
ncbi:DUF4407 domain-containing protein [Rathayibacter sp. AY1F7]|nr:DUF4407 domain-containing protein [Rathayibacter sp. AY1F2]PPH43697.1 DUF4407 domain-containing protein [Rathayibacter sp. AY1F7]